MWSCYIEGDSIFRVVQKMKLVNKRLKVWNREVFENVGKRVVDLRTELYKVQDARSLNFNDDGLDRKLTIEFAEALKMVESLLKQKLRVKWSDLKENNNIIF